MNADNTFLNQCYVFVDFRRAHSLTEQEITMPNYMLLLYEEIPSRLQKLSPEEMQKALEKYMAWKKKPFVVDSQRLAQDAGRVIRAQDGKARATDGPYSETKE